MLLKEKVQWRQRSKIKWIKEGDNKFKFFHRVTNGRRTKKIIKSMSEEGEALSNNDEISMEIVNFLGSSILI